MNCSEAVFDIGESEETSGAYPEIIWYRKSTLEAVVVLRNHQFPFAFVNPAHRMPNKVITFVLASKEKLVILAFPNSSSLPGPANKAVHPKIT
jgi:hypothetical protein